jgi:SAM-dependent methyltransferase
MSGYDQAYYSGAGYRNYRLQNPMRKLRCYRSLLESHVNREVKQPAVLDIGCAFGDFLDCLSCRWVRYGYEPSNYAFIKAENRHPAIRMSQFLPNCSFDAITAFDVLEHVNDLSGQLQYVESHLRPDGCFVFCVPVYDGPLGWLVRLLDRDKTHVHKKSRRWWLARVESSGFRGFKVVAWSGVFRYLFYRYYLHWPVTNFLRYVTPAILVVAKKQA